MRNLKELYDTEGSHFIEPDGSITFLYYPSDPLIGRVITLDSDDLHEWMLDDTGKLKEFSKDPNSDMYFLHIDNIPPNTFATYRIKVTDPVSSSFQIIPPPENQKKPLIMHHLDLHAQPISAVPEKIAYIQLGTAEVPEHLKRDLPSKIEGSVTADSFRSLDQVERDVWIYKPDKFDDLDEKERKVIFMLDGKDFCEKLIPYIDMIGAPFSNTAIVFIDPGKYPAGRSALPPPSPPIPIPHRVHEDYFETDTFSTMLGDDLIPKYCEALDVKNKNNVILSAHSLAAYPMIDVAEKHPNEIGGLFLFSPAINQNRQPNLAIDPEQSPELKKLPIFIQIGDLEYAIPPQAQQEEQFMQNKSRLAATQEFYETLVSHGYNVTPSLQLSPFGHDAIHVFEGMIAGMVFYQNRLDARTAMRSPEFLNQARAAAIPIDEAVQQKAKTDISTPQKGY